MESDFKDTDKPILVLVNPKSGTGKALELFKAKLEPRLIERAIKYKVQVTKFAGQVRKDVERADFFNDISGVVIVSGDGLVNELYNGLRRRSDWPGIARRTPIGLMPGGSGCALNCSLLKHLGQDFTQGDLGAEPSALNALSSDTVDLDLIDVELFTGERFVSFLGVTIGAIADCDINSEWLRCLGFVRSYLYIAWRFLFPSPNRARVSYLPLEGSGDAEKMPRLSQEPPASWVVEMDDYHVAYALNVSMLDPWTCFARDSRPGDGVLWLVLVRASISRMELLRWFASLSEGVSTDFSEAVDLIPVRAFRIEPIDPLEGCVLSLDAESVPFGPVQGRIMPRAAKLKAKLPS